MESAIVQHLESEFEPVAVVWSDTIPADAFQFKKERFGCILHLFAEASRRGRIAGACRDTLVCLGGRTALGFGADLVASDERVDHYAAVASKGLASTPNETTYRARMQAVRASWRPLLQYGERRHCSFDLARSWLLHEMPRFDIPHRYVLFKPLRRTEPDDDVRAVIFPVSPVELAGLFTLLASVMEGTDPLQAPPGADCFRIAGFAYAQHDAEAPRAVLGMLDVDGRKLMRKRFHGDTLTLTLPTPLFRRLEQEAGDSVLQTPGWSKLRGRG
jgi:hypothetical protein